MRAKKWMLAFLPAAQLAIARDGEVVFQYDYGDARSDSLTCIFSATRRSPRQLRGCCFNGDLREDELLVVDIVPEFDTNDKHTVTVGQLFAHTAGFPNAPFAPLDWDDQDKRYGRFRQWRLTWQPGTRFEYHPSSSMWVIVKSLSGVQGWATGTLYEPEFLEPLKLQDLYVGLPPSEGARTLPCVYVGEAMTPEEYKQLGMPVPPVTEVTEEAVVAFSRPEVQAVGVPVAAPSRRPRPWRCFIRHY